MLCDIQMSLRQQCLIAVLRDCFVGSEKLFSRGLTLGLSLFQFSILDAAKEEA